MLESKCDRAYVKLYIFLKWFHFYALIEIKSDIVVHLLSLGHAGVVANNVLCTHFVSTSFDICKC